MTAVPAMGVVAETMTALVLASEALRKFGGDSMAELVRNRDGFVAALGRRRQPLGRPATVPAGGSRGMTRLLLVGMMGAGKTTVGRWWPTAWAGPTSTRTQQVVEATGQTVPEIFVDDRRGGVPGRRGGRPPRGGVRYRAGGGVGGRRGGARPGQPGAAAPVGHGGVAAGRPGHPGRAGGRRRRAARCWPGTRPARWPGSTRCAARSTPSWPTWWSTSTAWRRRRWLEQVLAAVGLAT